MEAIRLVASDKTLKVSPAMAADAKPVFEVMEWKIGGGFYVKATLPNVAPENITGFETRNDAVRWIRNDSAAWLHTRQHVIEKKEAGK